MEQNSSWNSTSGYSPRRCPYFTSVFLQHGATKLYFVNCALNALSSFTTILASTFVLMSVRKITSLHRPSKVLLGNLFLTYLCNGAISQPSYIAFLYTKATQGPSVASCVTALLVNIIASTLGCVSLGTLTAISLDRYLALVFYLNYRTIITTRRAAVILGFVWFISISWGTSWHWCHQCYYPISIVILSVCLSLTSFCYLKIYLGLRHQQQRVEDKNERRHSLNLKVYRTSIMNLLIIHASLLLCFTPYFCSVLLVEFGGFTVKRVTILEFATTVMFFGSAFNSVVYCWRIREVRANLLETVCCHATD